MSNILENSLAEVKRDSAIITLSMGGCLSWEELHELLVSDYEDAGSWDLALAIDDLTTDEFKEYYRRR